MSPEAVEIGDAARVRVEPLTVFKPASSKTEPMFKTVSTNTADLEPDDQLPSVAILMAERRTPDGDANAGPPRFINDLTLTFLIRLKSNSFDEAKARARWRSEAIVSRLLTDPAFVGLFEGAMLVNSTEGVERAGEKFLGIAKLDLTVQFRTELDPVITDEFLELDVTARPHGKPASTPPVRGRVRLPPR